MNTIIHDPTRGWLLLTPDGHIEIEPKDWMSVNALVKDFLQIPAFRISVDAEFEVTCGVNPRPCECSDFFQATGKEQDCKCKIARLVKAKDNKCDGVKFCDCAKKAMANGANRDWVDETENECKFKSKEIDPSKVIIVPPVMISEHKSKPEKDNSNDNGDELQSLLGRVMYELRIYKKRLPCFELTRAEKLIEDIHQTLRRYRNNINRYE